VLSIDINGITVDTVHFLDGVDGQKRHQLCRLGADVDALFVTAEKVQTGCQLLEEWRPLMGSLFSLPVHCYWVAYFALSIAEMNIQKYFFSKPLHLLLTVQRDEDT
jgi:hypothetical protein